MLEFLTRYDAVILGTVVAILATLSIYTEWRFRKQAVAVNAKVIKRFPHGRYTTYFMEYEHEQKTRHLEYNAPHFTRQPTLGEECQMLISGENPPEATLPKGDVHVTGGSIASSNTSLAGTPIVGMWEGFWLAVGIIAIVYGFAKS